MPRGSAVLVLREWKLWHLFCYLLWREEVDTILLKDLHGFCEVHVRVGQNIVRWYLHLLRGFIHFIHCVKKTTRSDDGYAVDLIGLNQERMRGTGLQEGAA